MGIEAIHSSMLLVRCVTIGCLPCGLSYVMTGRSRCTLNLRSQLRKISTTYKTNIWALNLSHLPFYFPKKRSRPMPMALTYVTYTQCHLSVCERGLAQHKDATATVSQNIVTWRTWFSFTASLRRTEARRPKASPSVKPARAPDGVMQCQWLGVVPSLCHLSQSSIRHKRHIESREQFEPRLLIERHSCRSNSSYVYSKSHPAGRSDCICLLRWRIRATQTFCQNIIHFVKTWYTRKMQRIHKQDAHDT